MSDTATTTEAPAPVKFQDAMHEAAFTQLHDLIVTRNDLVGRANAANGDRVTLVEQITENSTDKAIVAARKQRDDAIMELHKLVQPQVEKVMADAQGSIEEVETELKKIDNILKPGVTYLRRLYGEEAAEALPSQARVKGVRINSGGSSGGRRIRGFNVIVTYAGETEEFENFASAAKFLGDVDTATLQAGFFEAAGNPAASKDAPDVVEFALTLTETDEEGNESEQVAEVKAYRTEVKAEAAPAAE